jgi:hypothetical protein
MSASHLRLSSSGTGPWATRVQSIDRGRNGVDALVPLRLPAVGQEQHALRGRLLRGEADAEGRHQQAREAD